MFGVAPDIETSIPYDILVYDDVVQFFLEKCEATCVQEEVFTAKVKEDSAKCAADLRHCLRVLHSLHIVHKDIKPSNTLYCSRLGTYVFCDFEIACYVKQDIGGVTRTKVVGTPKFMGPEMLGLLENSSNRSRVDLYYNDAAAL